MLADVRDGEVHALVEGAAQQEREPGPVAEAERDARCAGGDLKKARRASFGDQNVTKAI